MSETKVTNEVNQQFLRRTPVKLRQFSRLLNDLLIKKIDPLRVKAFLSQINKTKESCTAQGFESTAKLLKQLFTQLSLSEDSLDTQKPLLKRLSLKLQEHSEKLELGVKPQKEIKPPVETPEPKAEEAVEPVVAEKAETAILDEASQYEENLDVSDSIDSDLEDHGIYLDKGVIIFAGLAKPKYQEMSQQFESLGIGVFHAAHLKEARQHAIDNPGSIMVAPLALAESEQQLDDDEIETKRIPLIFTAEEDDQADRLQALRSGGTGYLVEPVSVSGLLGLIESQYDLHADSPYRVLIMEDSKAQAKFYDKVLAKGHFETRVVNNPTVFLEALRGFEPEIILMDMQMPGCSGIELTRVVRQMPRYSHLPIIFLSAEESARKQNQALLSGGTSFIVKPPPKEQLMFLVGLYAKRHRALNPQIGVNPDSGLVYSPQFKQQLSVEASRMTRNTGSSALAIIQLDEIETLIKNTNFSLINVAIQQLALLLKQRLRKSDIVGHLESGQIGVVLTTGKNQDWFGILDEIRLHFAELPFHLEHQDRPLSISIGLAVLSTNSDAHQWFAQSNQNLLKAIENGGDQIMPPSAAAD